MSEVQSSALVELRLSGQVQVALRRLLARLIEELNRGPPRFAESGELTGASGLTTQTSTGQDLSHRSCISHSLMS